MSTLGERIRQAREHLKMSQETLAKKLGIKQPSVQAMEKSKAKKTKHLLALADALKQSPEWLETGRGEMRRHNVVDLDAARFVVGRPAEAAPPTLALRPVHVVGAVQAGVWLEALEWPPDDQYDMPLPIPGGFRGFQIQGFEVRGPSMDEIYPHGSIVVAVKFIDLGRNPRQGERVIALRLRPGECEATVKEFRIGTDGVARLWPRSTHPGFQSPIAVGEPDENGEGPQIAYLVIGSYRPEL